MPVTWGKSTFFHAIKCLYPYIYIYIYIYKKNCKINITNNRWFHAIPLKKCHYSVGLFYSVSGVMFMGTISAFPIGIHAVQICFPPLVILSNRLQSLSTTVFKQDLFLWCGHKLVSMHITLIIRVVSCLQKALLYFPYFCKYLINLKNLLEGRYFLQFDSSSSKHLCVSALPSLPPLVLQISTLVLDGKVELNNFCNGVLTWGAPSVSHFLPASQYLNNSCVLY